VSGVEVNASNIYDTNTGLPVITAGGSIHWHEATKKWIAIFGGRVDDPTGVGIFLKEHLLSQTSYPSTAYYRRMRGPCVVTCCP
jgi:hypothetical protein